MRRVSTIAGRTIAGRTIAGRTIAVWTTAALTMVLLGAFVLSCGGVPKRHYFALTYPIEPAAQAAVRPPLHPFSLRVKPFGVGLPYNRPQIVYRQSLFEFNYYNYKMWSAKPQHMLRELVARHLEAARLVAEVSREYGQELPDYELGAEVLAIEEYDSGDVWYGHLAMRFELVRFRDRTLVWSYQFDKKRKVFEKKPVFVVRALSRIAEEEMGRITAELDIVLSKERGVEPTLVRRVPPTAPMTAPSELTPDAPAPPDAPSSPGDLITPDEPTTGGGAG